MNMDITTFLNQSGLLCGFLGTVLLFFAKAKGTIMADYRMRFDGLDDMAPVERNKKHVKRSHWRQKWFTPTGWILLSSSFLMQYIAAVS